MYFKGFEMSTVISPVYTTAVLGMARLNLGTRTYKFWHGTLNISRVNGKKTDLRANYYITIYKQNN